MRTIKKQNERGVVYCETLRIVNKNKLFRCYCPNCNQAFEMWASDFYRGSPCKCVYQLKADNKRLYSIWINMKTRCYNLKTPLFKNYGGRGISVCDEWRYDFNTFCRWALANGYSDNLSIDRINNDLGYSPDNCRWATMREQNRNRSVTLMFDCSGEAKTLKEICDTYGLNYKTEHTRLSRYGHDAEQRYLDKYVELEGEANE